MELGPRLKAARKLARLSQQELARIAGVRQATISSIETGRAAPDWTTVQALATALGMPSVPIYPAGITIDRVLLETARLAFARLSTFLKIDGDTVTIDFSRATEDDWAAVQEIIQDERVDGTIQTRIKLAPKLEALEKLMRYLLLEAGKPTSRVELSPATTAVLQQLSPAELDVLEGVYKRIETTATADAATEDTP